MSVIMPPMRMSRQLASRVHLRYGGRSYGKARSIYRRVKRVEKKVRNVIRAIERKRHEEYGALEFDTNTDTNIVCLSAVSEGDTEDNRTGLKISPKALRFKMDIYNEDTAYNSSTRLIIFIDKGDKQTMGSPTLAELLQQVTDATRIVSPYNWVNKKRFKILYDRVIPVGVNTSDSGRQMVSFNKTFKSLNVYFDSSANTDNSYNHIWFCVINDAVAGHGVSYNYYSRLTYTDN